MAGKELSVPISNALPMTAETDAHSAKADSRTPGSPAAGPEGVGPQSRDGDGWDQVLIGAIAGGEPQAMQVFYDRHAPFVVGILRSVLGESPSLEDALQDVFWQVWRTADHYDAHRGSPHTWLYQMARSRALDQKRRAPREMVQAELDTQDPDPGAAAGFVAVEGRAFLQQIRLVLSQEEEAMIHLVFDRGMTQAQAAAALHIPVGTAKGRVRSALRRLRAAVAQEGDLDAGKGDR